MHPGGKNPTEPSVQVLSVYTWSEIVARLNRIAHGTFLHKTFVYRHAETEFNVADLVTGQRDVDLTESGRASARQLRFQVPERFDGVYCSGLRRAQETARLALAQHSFMLGRIVVDRRFNEVAMGKLEGRKRRYIDAFAAGDIDFAISGGESYRSAAQRIFSAFIDVCEDARKRNHLSTDLIFAHAGVMRILATLVLEINNPIDMFSLKFSNQTALETRDHLIKIPNFWSA